MLRTTFGALFLSLAIGANASFELMLIPRNDGRMARFDPINQISLGSYFANSNNNISTVDGAGNCYVGNVSTSTIRRINYSTGEGTGSLSGLSQLRSLAYSSSGLVAQSLTTVARYSSTGALLMAAGLATGFDWSSGTLVGNLYYAFGVNTTTNVVHYQTVNMLNGSLSATTSTGFLVSNGSVLGKAGVVQNAISGARTVAFSVLLTSGSIGYVRGNLNSSDAITTLATGSLPAVFNTSSVMPAFLTSHGGAWLVGEDTTAGNTRFMQFELTPTFVQTQSYSVNLGAPIVGPGIFHPSMVVAPEPASFVMLTISALALGCRRKG